MPTSRIQVRYSPLPVLISLPFPPPPPISFFRNFRSYYMSSSLPHNPSSSSPSPSSSVILSNPRYIIPDSSISSSSLPPPLDETLADRLYALRDIIPPHSRRRIHTTFSTLSSYTSTSLKWTGKGLWVLSAGMIFWGVPFAMAWSEEVAIVEQEREIRAREQAGEMVGMGSSPGVGTGVGAKPAV